MTLVSTFVYVVQGSGDVYGSKADAPSLSHKGLLLARFT
jgi:hypothetical protein